MRFGDVQAKITHGLGKDHRRLAHNLCGKNQEMTRDDWYQAGSKRQSPQLDLLRWLTQMQRVYH